MRALVALLTFLFLMCTGGCSLRAEPPPQVSLTATAWVANPLVKVCYTAPVTTDEVQWALDLWAANGAPKTTAVSSYCIDTVDETHTVFVDAPQLWMSTMWEPSMRALTVVFSEEKNGPGLVGYIGLTSDDKRTLVHEIGHIWIHEHADAKGHVLSEYIDHFDWNFEGARKAFRQMD